VVVVVVLVVVVVMRWCGYAVACGSGLDRE